MADYNYMLQNQMWHDTNYSAQMQELEKADLSPGLIYGGSGAGASITNIPTGSIQGATAPSSTERESANAQQEQANSGMALMLSQQKLIQAQTDAAESQANLNNTQATKLSGVDTTKTEQDTATSAAQEQSITQGINNQKAQEALTTAQTKGQLLQNKITGDTMEAAEQKVIQEAQAGVGAVRSAMAQRS